MAELHTRLARHDRADDHRRIGNRVRNVGEDFALEAMHLRPLSAEPFDAGLTLTPRVDRHARVTVRQCQYSVPTKLIGQRVRVVRLVNELVEAADEMTLTKTVVRYGRVDLLCIDELGCMELDRRGAELLFQVLTEREEKNSVAIASNESFSGWTRTFTDPRLCAASPVTDEARRPVIDEARRRRAARVAVPVMGEPG